MKTWSIYLVRCPDGSLYTGISIDVRRRFKEHCSDKVRGAKFLRGKTPLSLVYQGEVGDKSSASKLEYRVKRLDKQRKEDLVAGNLSLEQLGLAL
ncbi:MAG: hypothetical protein COC19_07860 [SAR86 cluster bacterium]|uniref:GIY-YIG domain-containing protein n=1 Tax=SAR86 cluster bacterium TaxID=2030880 RepID=A0A2A4MGF1_9GAMM|nr:MAG: hypothetical protein COC19_07860 [SAR86 cluster bacterium]